MNYKKIRPFSDLQDDQDLTSTSGEKVDFVLATGWQRFWSKLFDLTLLTIALSAILEIVAPDFVGSDFFTEKGGSTRLGILLLPVAVLADAAILSMFGNTLGRAIIGIRVGTKDADNLDLSLSMRRAWRTYFHGMALGIPLVSFFAYLGNLKKLEKGELTSWDKALDTRVFDVSNAMWRTCLVAVMVIGIRGGMILADKSAIPEASAKPLMASTSEEDIEVDKEVLRVVSKTLKGIQPELRSDIIRIDGAALLGRFAVYYHTIDDRNEKNSHEKLEKSITEEFLNETIPGLCKDKAVTYLMSEHSLIYSYRYNFLSGAMPFELSASWRDCD